MVKLEVLLDSGSNLSAILEKFLESLDDPFPILPVTNVSVTMAAGAKEQKN